jgi:hypothetical protein
VVGDIDQILGDGSYICSPQNQDEAENHASDFILKTGCGDVSPEKSVILQPARLLLQGQGKIGLVTK